MPQLRPLSLGNPSVLYGAASKPSPLWPGRRYLSHSGRSAVCPTGRHCLPRLFALQTLLERWSGTKCAEEGGPVGIHWWSSGQDSTFLRCGQKIRRRKRKKKKGGTTHVGWSLNTPSMIPALGNVYSLFLFLINLAAVLSIC